MISKPNTDSDDSDDDNNLNNNIVGSDINNIDSTEFNDVEISCEVIGLQFQNKKNLCHWYINNHISHKALANLLIILRKLTDLSFPKDPELC